VGLTVESGIDDGHTCHAPVATFTSNDFGLHDVHGNVYEWCADGYGTYLESEPRRQDGLRLTPGARFRVMRGGSFDSRVNFARSAIRFRSVPGIRLAVLGLRPARPLAP
jgi:formylglycine-generating enzyme required for sulfatase activity